MTAAPEGTVTVLFTDIEVRHDCGGGGIVADQFSHPIGSLVTAIRRRDSMHARLISFSGADPENRERAVQTIRESVIPTLREYDGFSGYIALYDAENRRAKAVLLWESEEKAEAAEHTLAERRRQMASGVGLTVESADLYEALVVEVKEVDKPAASKPIEAVGTQIA
jgi:hypothetical protein